MSDVIISVDNLKTFMKESLLKAGVPNDDADIVVDVLISSDLRGIESHGIGRLQMYLNFIKDGVQTPVTKYEILKETPGTALIDAKFGMGHVVSYHAMKLAIEKAKKTGIAAVSVRNSTHFGICGYYPLMAIKENMAGFAVTNARPSIAPTFSNDPMFGTNPIAFGVPTDEPCPFLLDMATSITQRGKVEVYDRIGKTMPEGWAMDRDGNYVTDPTKLLGMFASKAASLLPLGGAGEDLSGYKGYGLAMMVEILSSAFSGGPFCWGLSGFDENGKKVPNKLGHFFMAINISSFIDIDEFKTITGNMAREMRKCTKLPGIERIYTAGEKEYDKEQEIPEKGVKINDTLQKTMKTIKADYGLSTPIPF